MTAVHLPCTNDDTRTEPECINGHRWPAEGTVVEVLGADHRIVGSEATITLPKWTRCAVEHIDTDIHSVMVTYDGVRLWVDLDNISVFAWVADDAAQAVDRENFRMTAMFDTEEWGK